MYALKVVFLFSFYHRYKRRLVCNPCEKHKLKEEPVKKSITRFSLFIQLMHSSFSKDTVSIKSRKSDKHIGMSYSTDSCLHSKSNSRVSTSFMHICVATLFFRNVIASCDRDLQK